MRTHAEGAGELRPSTDAQTVSRRASLPTTHSVPTPRKTGYSPAGRILRCPSCGATIRHFDALTGRYGDSLARCPRLYCRQAAPRWAWRQAA